MAKVVVKGGRGKDKEDIAVVEVTSDIRVKGSTLVIPDLTAVAVLGDMLPAESVAMQSNTEGQVYQGRKRTPVDPRFFLMLGAKELSVSAPVRMKKT